MKAMQPVQTMQTMQPSSWLQGRAAAVEVGSTWQWRGEGPRLPAGSPSVAPAAREQRTSPEELEEITRQAGLSVAELKDIIHYAFNRFDENGDGIMTFDEFAMACDLLSLKLPAGTAEKIFTAFSGGRGHLVPGDIEEAFEQDIVGSFVANLQKWYDESGLKKGEYLLTKFSEVMGQQKMPLHERLALLRGVLQSQGEVLAEFLEFIITSSLLASKLECLPNCTEVDPTDVVPLVILLAKNLKHAFCVFADRKTTDLSEENAAIFATVFKPAGLTVSSFENLFEKTGAQWVSLPAGTILPAGVFTRALGLIGCGRLRVRQQVAGISSMSDNIVELGLGSFLGASWSSTEGGDSAVDSLWANSGNYVEVVEDVRLLRWDQNDLRKYLAAHDEDEVKFHHVFSRSTMKTMALISDRGGVISRELPNFFRDVMLNMMNLLASDRISLWVHDDKRQKLWTIFVKEDGSSSYFEMDDSSGLAGHSFSQKESVNIPDCYVDHRFNAEVDKKTGYCTRSMLCVPVVDADSDSESPVGVIQLINRVVAKPGDHEAEALVDVIPFSAADEDKVKEGLWQLAIMIKNLGNRYNTA